MSSQLKSISCHSTSTDSLMTEMGKKLQKAAGQDLKSKLESGEIQLVNGRFIGESLKVKRPAKLKARRARNPIIA